MNKSLKYNVREESSMKKNLLLLLCIVAILSTKYLASHEKRQSALLLYNIEALAANSEHADIGHCYGTGTLDCPVSHDKVKYIAGGYSLEGLY